MLHAQDAKILDFRVRPYVRACAGCDWDAYARDNPGSEHRHNDAEDGPREGCCAHTCERAE